MCDRVYTMAAGRLTGEVSREDATQEVLMRHMTQDTPAPPAVTADPASSEGHQA